MSSSWEWLCRGEPCSCLIRSSPSFLSELSKINGMGTTTHWSPLKLGWWEGLATAILYGFVFHERMSSVRSSRGLFPGLSRTWEGWDTSHTYRIARMGYCRYPLQITELFAYPGTNSSLQRITGKFTKIYKKILRYLQVSIPFGTDTEKSSMVEGGC